jgi:membrane-associated protease RseP (regulator of RpoE activity)
MKPNRQYFVVRIDKEAQTKRRKFLTLKKFTYFGIQAVIKQKRKTGVEIAFVEGDSPAYKAYLNPGDVILALDNVQVNSIEDIVTLITKHKAGDEIRVTYLSRMAIETQHLPYPSDKYVTLEEKESELIHPEDINLMEYNLQWGSIVDVGTLARQDFPEARIGDILLFHHLVEYKPRSTGDHTYNDWHLVDTDDKNQDEYRVVRYDTEIFGVIRDNNELIPYRNVVFCHPEFRKASFQMQGGLWLPDAWEQKEEDVILQLEALAAEVKQLTTQTILTKKTTEDNYKRKEEILATVNSLNRERQELSRKMSKKKLIDATVMFFNPETTDLIGGELKQGDHILVDQRTIYPLEFGGIYYTLARVGYIEAIILSQ